MGPRQYEGMFLFDSAFAADLSKPEAEIRRILDRAGAELVFCKKWDERKLAYEIKGRKRGTYVLTYFRCPTGAVTGIERDAQLSESVLRMLLLRADYVSSEEMHGFTPPEQKAEVPPEGVHGIEPGTEKRKAPPEGEVIEADARAVVSSAALEDNGDAARA